MKPPTSSPRYSALDNQAIRRRHWAGEDECVVFNAISGDLHLLSPAALAIIDLLAMTPSTIEELEAAVPGLRPDVLRELVLALDRLGLIRPVYQ